MKRLWLFCALIMAALALPAEQAKRVYITLDVSGSMDGDKYNLANYTTQMIVTLCDDDDDVSLIVTGHENQLTRMDRPLSLLQHPLSNDVSNPMIAGNRNDEIGDVIAFNHLYKPSHDRQDWLFLIGDGMWSIMQENACTKFQRVVEQGTLNVCHLQTDNDADKWSPFANFVKDFGVVDIYRSDTRPGTIKAGCDHFARKILGFSDQPLDVKAAGGQGMSVKLELPVKEFYLVYQAEVAPTELPDITEAKAAGTTLRPNLRGTPTTQPLRMRGNEVLLSGNVWRVKAPATIPAGTRIEVQFSKDIRLENISFYPIVEGIAPGAVSLTREGSTLERLKDNTYSICRDERTATVQVQLSGTSSGQIPQSLLQQTRVIVKSGNKDYEARLKDGTFECDIPLTGEVTQYYAECDCPGYFKRITPITQIIKGDCTPKKPDAIPEDVRPTADLGTITFGQLKHDDLRVSIHDTESLQALDPTLFDISFEVENDFLYEDPKFHIENDTLIVLELHPYGDWCECLFPEGLNIRMVSTPRDAAFQEYDRNYRRTVFPIHMEVVKSRPWLQRCLWVLITLGLLLLVMAYLRGLLKKNRFHKGARLRTGYYEEDNPREVQKAGKPLRQSGFGPWLNRWLWPFGDERTSTSFVRPKTGSMTFLASESKNRILMSASSFDQKRMTVPNYTPPPVGKGKKEGAPISISAGTAIEIKKMMGGETTRLGHLKYVVEGKDDESGYRAFIGILFGLALIAFLALLWQMIRGVF